MVCDCDPAGGDMVAGLLVGRVPLDRGLVSWSAAARRASALDAATYFALHTVAVPEADDLWLLPGIQTEGQAAGLNLAAWDRLARAVQRAGLVIGRDVLVDTGRLGATACWPVVRVADRVVLTVRPTVRSVHAAIGAAGQLRSQLGDLTRVSALVVGDGPYSATEVAAAIDVPLAGLLPFDRGAATALSDGVPAGLRGLRRSRLVRAASGVAAGLSKPVQTRRVSVPR
jgi:hypothetical protein